MGLLVHAECYEARSFYEQLIPEFEHSPTNPLHLLLLKDIRWGLEPGLTPPERTLNQIVVGHTTIPHSRTMLG